MRGISRDGTTGGRVRGGGGGGGGGGGLTSKAIGQYSKVEGGTYLDRTEW